MTTSKPAHPIRVYGSPVSGHTHRVLLLLSLLGLPHELINVDLAHGQHKQPEFLAKNPLGLVPVMEDGDVRLYESNAILVYLASRYGDASWLPRDPLDAAAVQRWLSFASGYIYNGPNAARLIKAFGVPLNYERAKSISTQLFEVLDAELADRKFVLGATPSVADVAAYAYIAHAPEGGLSLEPYGNIAKWLKHIEALPGFIPMPALSAAA